MQHLLAEHLNHYDVLVINNESMEEETKGLLLMSIADANLFVLDSRRTPARQITSTDILVSEYQLPDTWFILNRFGYNPNVVKAILRQFHKLALSTKKKLNLIFP